MRIRTLDDHIIQCFSAFYHHPVLINEDAWHLMKYGKTKIMIDRDTMHLMEKMVCEWGFEPTSDTILTLKLTSTMKDKDERIKHWNQLYEYSVKLRSAMSKHFNKDKLDTLTNQLENITISGCGQEHSDSTCDDPKPEKTPVKTT